MSLREAIHSIKETIKDTQQHPGYAPWKAVVEVNISEAGITLINADNTKRYFAFADISDPAVGTYNDAFYHLIYVAFAPWEGVIFSNYKSAEKFADAVYCLKHTDIKKEREREWEDCLRQIRQAPIDLILVGATSKDLNLPCFDPEAMEGLESGINNFLLEWRDKGLPGRLQKSTSSQLGDLVIKLEKGVFRLDHMVKRFKDFVDQNALRDTPAKDSAEALSIAHLLE
jgi:hypothetical protein